MLSIYVFPPFLQDHICVLLSGSSFSMFGIFHDFGLLSPVLPSIGIGALSAREAEGRTNISAGEKVFVSIWLLNCRFFSF